MPLHSAVALTVAALVLAIVLEARSGDPNSKATNPTAPNQTAPSQTGPAPTRPRDDTPRTPLADLESPLRLERSAITDPAGAVAPVEASDMPSETAVLGLDRALGDRLRSHLALLESPDATEYAGWHAGTPLADLARLAHDARTAHAWLVAERSQPSLARSVDAQRIGFLRERDAVLQSEIEWIGGRVEELVHSPPAQASSRYAALDDATLMGLFDSPRDRYALKVQLREELAQLTQAAAEHLFAVERAKAEFDKPVQGLVLL